MVDSVIDNRDYWIGGSDIPAIMGKSSFSTPYELLVNKFNTEEPDSFMQKYIDYGNEMEPKIRDYINETMNCNYRPDVAMKVKERLRANVDGWDKDASQGHKLLEIKTYGDTLRMDEYILQMQLYMYVYDVESCLLAYYKRVESTEMFSFDDFEMDFNSDNLTTEVIYRDEELISKILTKVDEFIKLLDVYKVHPLTNEQFDMKYYGTYELSAQLNKLDEIMLASEQLKEIQRQEKEVKSKIRDLMISNDVRTMETDKFKVTASKDSEVVKFSEKRFKEEHPDLYKEYLEESVRKGSLRVTRKKV